jgi:hypothetical protein
MDLDLKGASIKRIMDNPGIAFLTQLVNKKVLAQIYGEKSDFYIKSINYDVVKSHNLLSMAVYSLREDGARQSIERKFFLPKDVPLKLLYFYFFINFRDKIIPLLVSACKPKWESLEKLEKGYFVNNISIHKQINMFIHTTKGNNFLETFKTLLGSMNYKKMNGEVYFDKINKVSRSQLFYEFVLMMGNTESYSIFSKWKDPITGCLKIIPDSVIDQQINELKFANKSERLFNLYCLDSIDGSDFTNLNDSVLNSYDVFNNKNIALLFNSSFLHEKALKLKKCIKTDIRIREDNTLTLNDCLSTAPYSL